MYTLYGIERSADSAKSYQRKIHQNKSQIGSCGLKRKHRICLVIQTFNVRNTDIRLQAYKAQRCHFGGVRHNILTARIQMWLILKLFRYIDNTLSNL